MRKIAKKLLNNLRIELENLLPVFMLVFVLNFCLPHVLLAQTIEPFPELPINAGRIEVLKKYPRSPTFPEIKIKKPRWTVNIAVTAYNSHPDQTDATPCITASGLNVCERNKEDIIATNLWGLPFGTKVRFPELTGDKIFTVHDRMNKRYWRTADIWMKDYNEAKQFGRKYTVMEIL